MSSSSSSAGVSFPGLLTILFVGLKLTGHISWPWFWVLSPIPITILLLLLVALVATIIAAVLER